MDSYLWLILVGLGIGSFVNLYQSRALFLVFLAFLFIVMAGQVVPDRSTFHPEIQSFWYLLVGSIEASFACLILATRARQAVCLASFSLAMLLEHICAYLAFAHPEYAGGGILARSVVFLGSDELYSVIIRAGEASQVIALTLLSNPVLRFWSWYSAASGEVDDGHKSISATG